MHELLEIAQIAAEFRDEFSGVLGRTGGRRSGKLGGQRRMLRSNRLHVGLMVTGHLFYDVLHELIERHGVGRHSGELTLSQGSFKESELTINCREGAYHLCWQLNRGR